MRLALLIVALPLWAQYTVTLEPQPEATRRVLPASGLRLWSVTVVADSADAPPLARSRLTAVTPVSEVDVALSKDILTRDASRGALVLLGRGFDAASPLIGPGLVGYGFSRESKVGQWAGGVVSGLAVVRNLLRGQAPDPRPYLDRLLPEAIPCRAHDCGTWFVLTGPSGDGPVTVRVESPEVYKARLDRIMQARRDAGLLP